MNFGPKVNQVGVKHINMIAVPSSLHPIDSGITSLARLKRKNYNGSWCSDVDCSCKQVWPSPLKLQQGSLEQSLEQWQWSNAWITITNNLIVKGGSVKSWPRGFLQGSFRRRGTTGKPKERLIMGLSCSLLSLMFFEGFSMTIIQCRSPWDIGIFHL